jgi:hypothetical protein
MRNISWKGIGLASASFDKTVKVWDLTHLGKKPEE